MLLRLCLTIMMFISLVLDIIVDCGVDWIIRLKWLIMNCYGEDVVV